ncbi:MAG: glycosyltransferase [Thermoanaerobaculia bacterium]
MYASGELPSSAFLKFPVPYVSSVPMKTHQWSWRKPVEPDFVISPLGDKPVPEAVEDGYFEQREKRSNEIKVVGSFARADTKKLVEQTVGRIERFRSDVRWQIYDHVATPEDLATVDAWVDPAVSENDFDGFTAEALVVGLPVVATRTPINVWRLEQGRTGLLVPPGDPNEMTHAILSILFKGEVAETKLAAARQTVSKFRSRQRLRILGHMYDTLIA